MLLTVVVFPKEVYFLTCLEGHSDISLCATGGGLKSIFMHGYRVFNGVPPPPAVDGRRVGDAV